MSLFMEFKYMVTLEGGWKEQTIAFLNEALSWWGDWCEYSEFLEELEFTKEKMQLGPLFSSSNKIDFGDILRISANGGMLDRWGDEPLENRDTFNPEVHRQLLEQMDRDGLSICFSVKTLVEGFSNVDEFDQNDLSWEGSDEDADLRFFQIRAQEGKKGLFFYVEEKEAS